jgi:prevent-host-death family protein
VTDVNIHEAKTHLSRLLAEVEAGGEVTICRAGKPIARVVPIVARKPITYGRDVGRFTVPEDFNEPLPGWLQAEFEGHAP